MSAPTGWRGAKRLTITEAARVLGISRSLAYEWVQDGRLPATPPINGRRWVLPAEVELLLTKAASEAVEQPSLFGGEVLL